MFAKGIVNLLLEGFSIPILQKILPLFELKNFTFRKLDFSIEVLIDGIVRCSKKGSYEAEKDAVKFILEPILEREGIPYTKGRLDKIPRLLDLIIPDKDNPLVIIESSYVVTSASSMGDKAKFEQEVGKKIKKFYRKAKFLGLVDGIGWYIRRGDLKKMVGAFDDVFTFHPYEVKRLVTFFKKRLKIS